MAELVSMEQAVKRMCLEETSGDPIQILRKMMALPSCHMHGPEHHVMVGCALLTAYKNAGGDLDLPAALDTMIQRAGSVPGGFCGNWGACGAGISTGTFIAVISGSSPLSEEGFRLAQKMTVKSLDRISDLGGPRCCKRDSYLAILSAVEYVKEHFGVEMESSDIVCIHSAQNEQCIGVRCPFFAGKG
ncbi:MAG: SAM-dependent methyltransferase [Clostridia bacterium]|nr:SAM-dependent methyltransferase [Clostridia bacterium]MBR5753816.1 SAM-dependent methyltransferase [Clostridia bacterium]